MLCAFDRTLAAWRNAPLRDILPVRQRVLWERILTNHHSDEAFHLEPSAVHQSQIILDSFERLLARPLLPRTNDAARDAEALWRAPFAVLSHGTQADPILNYANAMALELWEMPLPRLLATPSRLTAEPMAREARDKLMAEVTRTGFVTGYSGVRISATGRRFRIENVTIWNLSHADGAFAGQAATFDTWSDVAPPRV